MDCAIRIVGHVGHLPLTLPQHLHHNSNTVAVNIDVYFLEWLQLPPIFVFYDNGFRSANLELVPFAPHGFDQDPEVQFAASGYQEGVLLISLRDPQGNVGPQFLRKPFPEFTRGAPFAFPTAKGRCVHAKSHLDSWLLHFYRRQNFGVFHVCQSLTDLNILQSADRNNFACVSRIDGDLCQALISEQVLCLNPFRRTVQLNSHHLLPSFDPARVDSTRRRNPAVFIIPEVGNQKLERRVNIHHGSGDVF